LLINHHGSFELVLLWLTGQVLDCSLAKPQADQKSSGGTNLQKSVLHPTFPPRLGYGLVGGTYGALGAGYGAAGFAQVRGYSIPASLPPSLSVSLSLSLSHIYVHAFLSWSGSYQHKF